MLERSADADATAAVANMYRDILIPGRDMERSLMADADGAAVWLVGLASGLIVALGSDVVEARRILGCNYWWTLSATGASVICGVAYRVGSMVYATRLLSHLHALEGALLAFALRPDQFTPRAFEEVGTVVRAFLDEPEPSGEVDIKQPRERFRSLKMWKKGLVWIFGLCAATFASAMLLVARGLWVS